MTTPTDYKHIVSDPEVHGGRSIIAGHRIAVIDVALWTRQGMAPEQITHDFPLTLAEVHAALAYYYDHQTELDSQLERDEARLAEYARAATSPIMEELRRKATSMREDARSIALGVSLQYLELLATGYDPPDLRNQIVVFPNV